MNHRRAASRAGCSTIWEMPMEIFFSSAAHPAVMHPATIPRHNKALAAFMASCPSGWCLKFQRLIEMLASASHDPAHPDMSGRARESDLHTHHELAA
jgi:hypothetical protein